MKTPLTYFATPQGCPVCCSHSFTAERENKFDGYSFVEYTCTSCRASWFVQQLVTAWGDTHIEVVRKH